jgi:hypothetical protein
MKATRRGFFGMLAGLVAAAVVPKPLVALTLQPPTVPLLPEAALAGQKLAAKAAISQLIPSLLQLLQQPQQMEYMHQKGWTINFLAIEKILTDQEKQQVAQLNPNAQLRVYYNRVFIKYLYDSLSQGIVKDWSESRSFVEREAA